MHSSQPTTDTEQAPLRAIQLASGDLWLFDHESEGDDWLMTEAPLALADWR